MPVRRQKRKRRDRVNLDLKPEHSARKSPPITPLRDNEGSTSSSNDGLECGPSALAQSGYGRLERRDVAFGEFDGEVILAADVRRGPGGRMADRLAQNGWGCHGGAGLRSACCRLEIIRLWLLRRALSRTPGLHFVLRQIAGCVVLHFSDLLTRYWGRIRSEEPTVQSDRSTHASLVAPAERRPVFVLPVVAHATETLLAQDQTIRVGPMPLILASGARLIDSDERRRR